MADEAILERWLTELRNELRVFWRQHHEPDSDDDVKFVALMFASETDDEPPLIRRFCMVPESGANTDYVDDLIQMAHEDAIQRTLSGETPMTTAMHELEGDAQH